MTAALRQTLEPFETRQKDVECELCPFVLAFYLGTSKRVQSRGSEVAKIWAMSLDSMARETCTLVCN